MKKQEIFLFLLIRKALVPNSHLDPSDLSYADWDSLLSIAEKHAIEGILFDTIKELPPPYAPTRLQVLQLVSNVSQLETEYQRRCEVTRNLKDFWGRHGIDATMIKGRAIAQYYPVPSHRYSCDVDVFIEKDWTSARQLLADKGVSLNDDTYKEVSFDVDQVHVECHRLITPHRGLKHLQRFEVYLRTLLHHDKSYFADAPQLQNPPLLFTKLLYVEHALGDLQMGKLNLRHILDWMVLRQLDADQAEFEQRCREFSFDRMLGLVDALADVVEGKREVDSLTPTDRAVLDEVLGEHEPDSHNQSYFVQHLLLLRNLLRRNRYFKHYGYCSMPEYVIKSAWCHLFNKDAHL